MAKTRAKSDDAPTITVKVEKGRLVPVSAYDAELIERWREGAVLNIAPVPAVVRSDEKKYFAMLSTLLREAETPWTNTDTAHEAIKLATGFIVPIKRKSGAWGSRSRHISSFTDAELTEFLELFRGIVRERFGIDPDTLQREAPDTGSESSGAPSNGAADDGPDAPPYPGVSVGVQTPAAALVAVGVPKAGGNLEFIPRETPPARGLNLSPEELDWLKLAARMLVSASSPGGEVAIVDRQVKAIKANHTPPGIRAEVKELAQRIYRHCREATRGEHPLDARWVANMAGCNPSDLRAEAR